MNADHDVILNPHDAERAFTQADDLVSAARERSPEAFTKLHALYSRRLYKTIIAITRDPEDAEDALQATFLRAYLAIHTFEGRSHIYTWLTRIAINSARRIVQRRRARPEVLFDPQPQTHREVQAFFLEVKDSSPNPEQIYDVRQRHMRVLRGLRNLSPELREPIQMQVMQSFSLKDIGQALNLSEAAVKSRLHRARLRLSAFRELEPCRPRAAQAANH
jgi:RNA polymerase sigma-70 factor (ECF subfamily)